MCTERKKSTTQAEACRKALCELLDEPGGDAEQDDEGALALAYAELDTVRRERRPK